MKKNLFLLIIILLSLAVSDASAQANEENPPESIIPVACEYLIGGLVDGKWVHAGDMAEKIKTGSKFQRFNFNESLGETTCEKIEYKEEFGDLWFMNFSVDSQEKNDLKIGSDLAKILSKPTLQTGGLQPYEKIIANHLQKNAIKAKPQITKLIRVDLDGDKTDEVIIVASNVDARVSVFKKDTYSMVLFRKLVNGKVLTQIVHENYYHEDRLGNADSPIDYEIPFIVDIDGDGCMEVIKKGIYHEGDWYNILKLQNTELTTVL